MKAKEKVIEVLHNRTTGYMKNHGSQPPLEIVFLTYGAEATSIIDINIDTEERTINVLYDDIKNITKVISTFTTTNGVNPTINGVEQISGQNVNDFTNPVTYNLSGNDWQVIFKKSI